MIRRHASFSYTEVGKRVQVGRTSTGTVYEQAVIHEDPHGIKLSIRKIVIELDEPTSDGDTMIEVLSNLPADVSALAIAESYRSRWTIEGVFGELTLSLNGRNQYAGVSTCCDHRLRTRLDQFQCSYVSASERGSGAWEKDSGLDEYVPHGRGSFINGSGDDNRDPNERLAETLRKLKPARYG